MFSFQMRFNNFVLGWGERLLYCIQVADLIEKLPFAAGPQTNSSSCSERGIRIDIICLTISWSIKDRSLSLSQFFLVMKSDTLIFQSILVLKVSGIEIIKGEGKTQLKVQKLIDLPIPTIHLRPFITMSLLSRILFQALELFCFFLAKNKLQFLRNSFLTKLNPPIIWLLKSFPKLI